DRFSPISLVLPTGPVLAVRIAPQQYPDGKAVTKTPSGSEWMGLSCTALSVTSLVSGGQVEQAFRGRCDFPLGHRVRVGQAIGTLERGMLAGLNLTLGEWYEVAGRALSVWPVEQVAIADVPGLSFTVSAPTAARPRWVLTGQLRVPGRRVPLAGGVPVVSAL